MHDPSRRQGPRVIDVVLYLFGVAGLAAAITLLFLGMRAVMDVGGMCAEGGPYVIEQHCPDGAPLVTFLGFMGGFASLLLAGWKGASIGGGAGYVVYLAWPAVFGVLGFNFLQYGFDAPGDDPGWAWGWLVTGVVFETMALGPLLIGVWLARAAGDGATAAATRGIPGGARLGTALRDARGARDARRSAIHEATPAAHEAGAPSGESEAGAAGAYVLVDALERLAALREDGSLTSEEYARATAELLDRAGA